jgi:hypothetical protein
MVDLRAYLLAVFGYWINAYWVGTAIPEVLGRVMPTTWAKWVMPDRIDRYLAPEKRQKLYRALFLFGILAAGYMAWDEQYQAASKKSPELKPSFDLSMQDPSFIEDPRELGKKFVDVYIFAAILNTGAPSSAGEYRLEITLSDLKLRLQPADIPEGAAASPTEQELKKRNITRSNALDVKTMESIGQNKRASGWLRFASITQEIATRVQREGATFVLSTKDAVNPMPYTTQRSIGGPYGVCVDIDVTEGFVNPDLHTQAAD